MIFGSQLQEPRLLFSPTNKNQTAKNPYEGLLEKQFGPYSQNNLDKKLKPIVVCPKPWMKQAKKLHSGLKGKFRSFDGFRKIFQTEITDPKFSPIRAENITTKAYEKHLVKQLDSLKKQGNIVYLIIPETPESQIKSPYYRSKAILTSHGIPSQMITKKTITGSNFMWSIANIALASYAKIGGVPWTLDESLSSDVFIGIGMHATNPIPAKETEKVLGIATVFSRHGQFLFTESSTIPKNKDYLSSLKPIIKNCIRRYVKAEGTLETATFHLYKKWKKEDAETIREICHNFDARANFLRVSNSSNHVKIFSEESDSGIEKSGMKIDFTPHKSLLLTSGDDKTSMGVPKPYTIQTKNSKLNDELIRDIYHLCYINWKGLKSTSKPITSQYPHEVAKITKKMKQGEEIDSFTTNQTLSQRPWFL